MYEDEESMKDTYTINITTEHETWHTGLESFTAAFWNSTFYFLLLHFTAIMEVKYGGM